MKRICLPIFILGFFFSFLLFAPRINNVFAATVTLTATADTKIVGSPTTSDTNYGTSTTIETRKTDTEKGRVLISFAISSVPSNATIDSATFSIYFYDCGRLSQTIDDLDISRITGVWKENLATWNTEKNNFDFNNALHKTAPCSSTGKYLKYEIKTFVNNWRNGTWINYGIGLSGDEGAADSWRKSFYSKEHGSNNPPKLTINYTVPAQPTSDTTSTGSDQGTGDTADQGDGLESDEQTVGDSGATPAAKKATPSSVEKEKAGFSPLKIVLLTVLILLLIAVVAGYIFYRQRKNKSPKKDSPSSGKAT